MGIKIRKQNILRFLYEPEPVDFADIFSRLEDRPDEPQSKRIQLIVEMLSLSGSRPGKLEAASALARLRKLLSSYQWVRQVTPSTQGLQAILRPASWEKLSDDDRWEYRAVDDLLEILRYGDLSRLRRCANAECKRWIYAKGRQQFCGGNCRQHHHEANPEKHAQKLRRMKSRYEALKDQEKNPLSRVGLNRRKKRNKNRKSGVGA